MLRSHLTWHYRARLGLLKLIALPFFALAVVAEAIGRLGRTR